MMKLSLNVKLTVAFYAVTSIILLIVSVMINVLLESRFKEYVVGQQEKRINDTAKLISERYNDWGGKWDLDGIETIGVNTLGEGLIVTVYDQRGGVVWDARVHNGGMCTEIIEHMSRNMLNYSPEFKGGYTEKEYPLQTNNTVIGKVKFGYYGPYFYNDNEIQFLGTINNLLLWSVFFAAFVSMAFGFYMAQRLSKPINRVISTARQIAHGEFGDRVREPSKTKEIMELTSTINSLAETLGRQDQLRKRLTADVAHELRTPLATIQSHLEAMIDGIWKPDKARLISCHEETLRISKLVGDLEKLTRYEGENLVLDKKRFDLSSLLSRLITNYESQFMSSGVALQFVSQEIWVEADEDKISQVFINLLSNALKYTPEGGTVKVEMNKTDEAAVTVRDSGIGIPEEDLPHIFERFYRTDKSRSRLTGGSGIGLTIAKSIVDAHHGSISVASKLNEGSAFVVLLPLT